MKSMRGFTIIELLIVVAILAIVGFFSIPFVQTFQISSDLNSVADQLTQAIRRAQLQARAGQNDDDWGVAFNEDDKEYIIFKGTSYASRDSIFDEVIGYPSRFSAINDLSNEIIFFKYSGAPTASGTITIVDDQGNEQRTIRVSGIGVVSHD